MKKLDGTQSLWEVTWELACILLSPSRMLSTWSSTEDSRSEAPDLVYNSNPGLQRAQVIHHREILAAKDTLAAAVKSPDSST